MRRISKQCEDIPHAGPNSPPGLYHVTFRVRVLSHRRNIRWCRRSRPRSIGMSRRCRSSWTQGRSRWWRIRRAWWWWWLRPHSSHWHTPPRHTYTGWSRYTPIRGCHCILMIVLHTRKQTFKTKKLSLIALVDFIYECIFLIWENIRNFTFISIR